MATTTTTTLLQLPCYKDSCVSHLTVRVLLQCVDGPTCAAAPDVHASVTGGLRVVGLWSRGQTHAVKVEGLIDIGDWWRVT